MKNNKLFLKIGLILLLPMGVFISHGSSFHPDRIERFYSRGLYRVISPLISGLTGFLPFSVAEFILIFFVIFIIRRLIKTGILISQHKVNLKSMLAKLFTSTLLCISILYFSFIMVWGLNYYRLPFSEIAGLDTQPASTAELTKLCEDLIHEANGLRENIPENSQGVMLIPLGKQDVFHRSFEGYAKAAFLYPQLGGTYGTPKGIIFSSFMSYAGISGIYFPFTGEANVNSSIPDCMLPSTTSHEMAHQRGFSREDEANYIAYLTCTLHPDRDFQYSGTLLALIYSMNALYKYDKDGFDQLRGLYGDGIKRDLMDLNQFWESYEGPMERASTKMNNAYLKANNQKDGVHSYGRMVDLLIANRRLGSSK